LVWPQASRPRSALILDFGALVAADRDDRAMVARLRAGHQHGLELRSNTMIIAQVWRDCHGRQVNLVRLLQALEQGSAVVWGAARTEWMDVERLRRAD
jgi:hypothetical protein